MKRAVVGLVTVLSLALGAGVAQAHGPGDWGQWGGGNGQSPHMSSVVAVAGVVTSVDQTGMSFDANAFVPQGEGFGWHHGFGDVGRRGGGGGGGRNFHSDWLGGPQSQPSAAPTPTPVTITTNGATTFRIDGQTGSLSGLVKGSRFVALFNGSPGDTLQTLVASPVVAVFAHTPPVQHQLYAFVGTVTGVDTTADTVSVTVADSIPSALAPSGTAATFTVSPSTLILGGTATNGLFGGSLADVSMGDVVAGGLIGPAGETLTQVESSPLQVLVDFPKATTSTTSSSVRKAARQRALSQALTLFGYKTGSRTTGKGHKARRGKKHAHHGRRGTSRTRAHAGRTRT